MDGYDNVAKTRKEIGDITENILELFLKRQIASRRLARHKSARGIGINNAKVEHGNILHAREFALKHKINPGATTALMRLLIKASKEEQRRELRLYRR